ncbi:MAG: hypothetical protein V4722_06380 [Bacteroidota bacterium]
MAIYTSTIQLHGASETDFTALQTELKAQAKKRKQHFELADAQPTGEERKYFWEGNVTLQKIAETILQAAPKIGKKYSFSIMRNKQVAGSYQ